MADLSVTPVGTQIKPMQTMSLGEMANLMRSAQAYQQAEKINPLLLKQAEAEAQVSAGTAPPRIAAAQSQQQLAAIQAKQAEFEFANKQSIAIANRLTSLINNPLIIAAEQNPSAVNPEMLKNMLVEYGQDQAKALGIPQDKVTQLIQPYIDQANNPAALRRFLKEKFLTTLDQGARATAMQPSGIPISTGAGGYTAATNIFGPQVPGTPLPGTTYETQVPPTQEVVTPTGGKQLLGPISQRTGGAMVTALDPVTQAAHAATAEIIKEDIPTTFQLAADARPRIAIFQNIKKLAPDAFTGPTAERRQTVANFAQMLGIPAFTLETATTDELMKNTKLLALAGGNTDAARSLAEFANPNNKMSKEGIARVVDQLMSIEDLRIAKANYLTPVLNNPVALMKRKLEFDQISDPRIFQQMEQEDVDKLKKSMSQREIDELTRKIRLARQLGIIK